MNTMNLIPFRLRALLKENRKTQKELAQYLNVTDNTVSYYCNGTRTPNLEQLKKIAVFFNTTIDFLVGLTCVKCTAARVMMNYTGLSEEDIMGNALTADDMQNMLNMWSDGVVLVNGSDRYTITYDYNDGTPIIDIKNKECICDGQTENH